MPKQVVVYSQPGWLFCEKVKEFLSQQGVPYHDRNIAQDEQALVDLERLGYLTTPVTTIDSEVVVGFNRKKPEELLSYLYGCHVTGHCAAGMRGTITVEP